MDKEALQLLVQDTGKHFADLVTGVVFIVDALKRQPGFNVSQFEQEMREQAEKFPGEEQTFIRLMLRAAAGDGSLDDNR